ncbi:MAG: arginine--tRNA ligase [Bacteroidota bacterium]
MHFEEELKKAVADIILTSYSIAVDSEKIAVQKTLPDFEGDYTVVLFPLLKIVGKSPDELGPLLGTKLMERCEFIQKYNLVKGFLNVRIHSNDWLSTFYSIHKDKLFGHGAAKQQTLLIEYCSPNTNKPLHLGHIRNCLLGHSLAEILEVNGYKVVRANLINDRGIHICKTMLAWQKWGQSETPESQHSKGDHFVGDLYILFDKNLKTELQSLMETGLSEEEAKKQSTLLAEAQQMLRKWEERDMDVIALWKKMNKWVLDGFLETFEHLGIHFDVTDHESELFSDLKKMVDEFIEKGIFKKEEDGSVTFISPAFAEKEMHPATLLRADGTSLYITQDVRLFIKRMVEYNPARTIYVVGNEQLNHFQWLAEILSQIAQSSTSDNVMFTFNKERMHHFAYGMVELPSGKMKSREGTVVDADDLMDEMLTRANEKTHELGKTHGMDAAELDELYQTLGLGALKYHLLKVEPKKNILFNPEESVDFEGNTGPFIQYTFARIQSVLRKADEANVVAEEVKNYVISEKERFLLRMLCDFPNITEQAAKELSPALIANYVYALAKEYNQFYHDHSVLKADSDAARDFRIHLSHFTGEVIKKSLSLLGIGVPFRM